MKNARMCFALAAIAVATMAATAFAPAHAAEAAPIPAELVKVQRGINFAVKFVPETGSHDYWRVAKRQGDCEDIALRKRVELIKRGWPADDLQIVILIFPDRTGHATLYVKSAGLILDNASEFKDWPVPIGEYKAATGAKVYCVAANLTPGDFPANERCAPKSPTIATAAP